MYKPFVQDNIFISRLYLTESGRSTQHHHIIHVSITSSAHPDEHDCNDAPPVCCGDAADEIPVCDARAVSPESMISTDRQQNMKATLKKKKRKETNKT